jgi:hypothetical protein
VRGQGDHDRHAYREIARNREVGVVEYIGHLRPEPHLEPLRQVDGLEERQRYSLRPRSDDIAGAGIPESSNGIARIGKCGGINPLVNRLARVRIDAGDGISDLDCAGKCSASSRTNCPERSGGRAPVAEKGVRGVRPRGLDGLVD